MRQYNQLVPIIFVQDTQSATKPRVRRMLEEVSRSVGRVLDVPRRAIMVRYEPGKPANYWEGEDGKPPAQGRRVFVLIKITTGKDPKRVGELFGEIASTVAGSLNILPEAVWTQVEEMDPGRAGYGGLTYEERRKRK